MIKMVNLDRMILLGTALLTPLAIESKFHRLAGFGAMVMSPEEMPKSYWTHSINYGIVILQILLLIYYYALREKNGN